MPIAQAEAKHGQDILNPDGSRWGQWLIHATGTLEEMQTEANRLEALLC